MVALQQNLARRSTKGRRVVTQGSGHNIQLYRPGFVAGAVRSLLAAQQTVTQGLSWGLALTS